MESSEIFRSGSLAMWDRMVLSLISRAWVRVYLEREMSFLFLTKT